MAEPAAWSPEGPTCLKGPRRSGRSSRKRWEKRPPPPRAGPGFRQPGSNACLAPARTSRGASGQVPLCCPGHDPQGCWVSEASLQGNRPLGGCPLPQPQARTPSPPRTSVYGARFFQTFQNPRLLTDWLGISFGSCFQLPLVGDAALPAAHGPACPIPQLVPEHPGHQRGGPRGIQMCGQMWTRSWPHLGLRGLVRQAARGKHASSSGLDLKVQVCQYKGLNVTKTRHWRWPQLGAGGDRAGGGVQRHNHPCHGNEACSPAELAPRGALALATQMYPARPNCTAVQGARSPVECRPGWKHCSRGGRGRDRVTDAARDVTQGLGPTEPAWARVPEASCAHATWGLQHHGFPKDQEPPRGLFTKAQGDAGGQSA